MKRLVLLGPQGSGKGTQAALLVERKGYACFSMGDALREKQRENTDEGRMVRRLLDEGRLVPNEITNNLIREFVLRNDTWIADGYPRNMGQADFLDSVARPDAVIVLQLSDDAAVERLGGRRVCPKGHNYHIRYKPPQQEGVCDKDGLPLKQREDDTPDAIRERLEIYHKKTVEVLEHYREILIEINADQPIEDVHEEIVGKLGMLAD